MSSVQETLLPLRGLAQWSRATGDERARGAARRAAEFLLERRLLWRKRDGVLIEPEWGGRVDNIHYPIRFYDVLSALLVMTEMGVVRDRRCQDALNLLEQKRLADGSFPAEWTNVKQADRDRDPRHLCRLGPTPQEEGQPVCDRGCALRAQAGGTSSVKRRVEYLDRVFNRQVKLNPNGAHAADRPGGPAHRSARSS